MSVAPYIRLGLAFIKASREGDVDECVRIASQLRTRFNHTEKRLRVTMEKYGMSAEKVDTVIARIGVEQK